MIHPKIQAQLPKAFTRNQLKNLARRKGFHVIREYRAELKQYIYRIERIKGLRNAVPRIKSLEYCNTESHTAKQRCFLHLIIKKDVK